MHQFITALRQLRHPVVLVAVITLVLQALVAGLSIGHAAAQLATFGPDAICHGDGVGDPAGQAPGKAAHDCCTFCTAAAPAVLSAIAPVLLTQLVPVRQVDLPAARPISVAPRAIRAGPSQAPPIVA